MAVYWIGQNGNVYYKGDDGKVVDYGKPDAGTDDSQFRIYREGYGNLSIPANRIPDPNPGGDSDDGGGGGGGYTAPAKVLDTAQIQSLDSLIESLATIKERAVKKAAIKRDTSRTTSLRA